MKLYELTSQHHNALSELAELDLDQETIENTLEGLRGDLEVKCKSVAAFIMNREAEINAVKEAAKKLSERASKESKALERLTEYLRFNMEANDITEIRSPELILKIKKNPPKVIIDDEFSIEKRFLVKKTTESPDKKAIKKAIQYGEKLDWVRLESSTSLSIE